MKCGNCTQPATLHITEVFPGLLGELHLCEMCAHLYGHVPDQQQHIRFEAWGGSTTAMLPGSPATPLPQARDSETRFEICRLCISEIHEEQLVVLREVDGDKVFSIMIGIFEATSIDRRLKKMPCPRPLTHDAWADSIAALGGWVQDVCISELRDNAYYAQIRVRLRHSNQFPTETVMRSERPPSFATPSQLIVVDVRPSDAFVMALIHNTGIYIKDEILAEVCG